MTQRTSSIFMLLKLSSKRKKYLVWRLALTSTIDFRQVEFRIRGCTKSHADMHDKYNRNMFQQFCVFSSFLSKHYSENAFLYINARNGGVTKILCEEGILKLYYCWTFFFINLKEKIRSCLLTSSLVHSTRLSVKTINMYFHVVQTLKSRQTSNKSIVWTLNVENFTNAQCG